MTDHIVCMIAGPIVGGLLTLAFLILWAVRGSKWLVSGK